MKPSEALEKCIEAGIFIERLRMMGPGKVVQIVSDSNPEIKEALAELSSDDLKDLRLDYATRLV